MLKNRNIELYLLVFFILVSIVVRYYFVTFPKHLLVYNDELIYLHMAESFISGRGFSVYNIESGFQKILYSIILSPAYLVSDREITIKLISIINILIMTSGVIPVWLLAKKIINSQSLRLLIVSVYLVSADMVYTMTFMSEILYYPMALWFIYLIYKLIDENNIKYKTLYAVGLGIFLYLMYLTKEVALVFLIALPALSIFSIAIFLTNKSNEKINCCVGGGRHEWKNITYSTVIIFITFIVIYLIMKNTVFTGLGNSYNQMGIEVLFKDERIRYLLYGFVYYLFSCIIAFGVLPVIAPTYKFSSLNIEEKKLYFLLITLLMVTALGVAYSITIREDYGTGYELKPVAHLRYIGYIMYPLFIIFLKLFEYNKKESFYTIARWILMLSIFGLIFIMFWRGITVGSYVDQILLQYLRKYSENEVMRYTLTVTLLTLLAILFFDKFKITIYAIFFILFFCIQIYNNNLKIDIFNKTYSMTKEQVSEAINLREFINNNSNKSFAIIVDSQSKCKRILDTYINNKNMYTISYQHINEIQKTGNGSTSQLKSFYRKKLYNLPTIDYIILMKDIFLPLRTLNPNHKLALSNNCYNVYDIKGEKFLPLIKPHGEYVYTPENYWPFASRFNKNKYISTGKGALVFGPYITLPAGKYTFEIYYTYKGKPIPQDTILGKSDIYSTKVNLDWKQYVKNFTPSSNIVRFDNIIFDKNIPNFELRMFTDIAGVKVEKIIINKLE